MFPLESMLELADRRRIVELAVIASCAFHPVWGYGPRGGGAIVFREIKVTHWWSFLVS